MYKPKKWQKSTIKSCETYEGETIEQKIERIVTNKEPIKDGAPQIYTERKDGIIAAYNIRTDRFEIAAEAMDKVAASIAAKREERAKAQEVKIVNMEGKEIKDVGAAQSTQGETGAK